MPRSVLILWRPIKDILTQYPDQWVVLRLEPGDDQRGQYVLAVSAIADPRVGDAVARERDGGYRTAILFTGQFAPADTIVAF
jgi:hypothetical protein